MELVFIGAFTAGVTVVLGSLVAVLANRVRERALVLLTGLLAFGAAACAVALGLNVVDRYTDTRAVLLGAAGLGAATLAEAGLVALVRGLRRLREEEALVRTGQERISAVLSAHADERARELEHTLSRERANASHILGQQERKLALERRDLVARQADGARAELAQSIAQVQERLEQRLAAWAADLDRGQHALEARLNELAQRQAKAIDAYEARLAADSDHLRTVTDEQQAALARLRTELQEVGREILDQGRTELENHALERRRALDELANRMRERERELRDQMERDQGEAIARLASGLAEEERRQLENVTRTVDRAATRLAEEADRRFDAQIRQSREKSAARLTHELDKAIEQFARRAEKEIAGRLAQATQETAVRLERRVVETTREAESQHEVSAERFRALTNRLDEALVQAEERIAAFEARIESEMAVKVEELERSIRAARN